MDENGKCTCKKADCGSPAKHPKTFNGVHWASHDPSDFNWTNSNIGIATGEPSGFWVLDDDNPAMNKPITDGLPKTWKARTGGNGFHHCFKHTGKTKHLKNVREHKVGDCLFDVCATNGYVVAPPSKHESGGSYEWIVHPCERELAEAPDWLVDMLPKHDEPEDKGNAQHDGDRVEGAFNDVDPMNGTFTVCPSIDEDELTERARAYLVSCPIAISGHGGHDVTYSNVCNLVELFGSLTDDELFSLLSEWNKRCQPPWSEKELRHKLSQARKNTGEERRVDTQISPVCSSDDFPMLHEDALYGLFGDIIKAITPETEADPAGVLMSLLVAFGNAVGNGPRFKVGASHHHVNLFAALCGDTANGKGQAWAIVQWLLHEADPEWLKECLARGFVFWGRVRRTIERPANRRRVHHAASETSTHSGD